MLQHIRNNRCEHLLTICEQICSNFREFTLLSYSKNTERIQSSLLHTRQLRRCIAPTLCTHKHLKYIKEFAPNLENYCDSDDIEPYHEILLYYNQVEYSSLLLHHSKTFDGFLIKLQNAINSYLAYCHAGYYIKGLQQKWPRSVKPLQHVLETPCNFVGIYTTD